MKTHYKLLVLDVDGTLVNKAGNISDSDLKALAEARKSGIQVSLSTGRSVKACLHILESLGLDGYHIFFDGALVYNPTKNEEIYSRHMPPEIVRQACETALEEGVPLDLFSTTQYFALEESWRTAIRRDYFKITPTLADFRSLWKREKIIKGSIVTGNPEEEKLVRSFMERFQNNLEFKWTVTPAFPDYYFINVNNAGVSKGKALEALADYLGLSLEEVVAIGDGSNDISLLSTAGLAVAMQNSPEELKRVADDVTADIEHSGVARAVQKYLLS